MRDTLRVIAGDSQVISLMKVHFAVLCVGFCLFCFGGASAFLAQPDIAGKAVGTA